MFDFEPFALRLAIALICEFLCVGNAFVPPEPALVSLTTISISPLNCGMFRFRGFSLHRS